MPHKGSSRASLLSDVLQCAGPGSSPGQPVPVPGPPHTSSGLGVPQTETFAGV